MERVYWKPGGVGAFYLKLDIVYQNNMDSGMFFLKEKHIFVITLIKNYFMDKVKCKYIFKDDYNPIYVNGAQGGINPQGEIVINFYLERNALPVSQTYEITEGKIDVSKEIESEPNDFKNSFVRVMENGVVMNYQTAKEIHKWLGSNIEKLEQLTSQRK